MDNADMETFGHIQNGVVVFDGPALPEGAAVTVALRNIESKGATAPKSKIEFPLVRSRNPGSVKLSCETIAAILEADDIADFAGTRDVSP